jgi:uncharacterized protein with HEPN domain
MEILSGRHDRFCRKGACLHGSIDQPGFVTSDLTYDATVRNLELLGEAASHIPAEIRESASEIPWRQIIAIRNRLIHAYLGIDNDILWSIIEQDIPLLLPQLKNLKSRFAE